jgi:hypothetical protein
MEWWLLNILNNPLDMIHFSLRKVTEVLFLVFSNWCKEEDGDDPEGKKTKRRRRIILDNLKVLFILQDRDF